MNIRNRMANYVTRFISRSYDAETEEIIVYIPYWVRVVLFLMGYHKLKMYNLK